MHFFKKISGQVSAKFDVESRKRRNGFERGNDSEVKPECIIQH